MSQKLESVQSIYAAFGKGDVPGILAKLADDVEWEDDGADRGISRFKHLADTHQHWLAVKGGD